MYTKNWTHFFLKNKIQLSHVSEKSYCFSCILRQICYNLFIETFQIQNCAICHLNRFVQLASKRKNAHSKRMIFLPYYSYGGKWQKLMSRKIVSKRGRGIPSFHWYASVPKHFQLLKNISIIKNVLLAQLDFLQTACSISAICLILFVKELRQLHHAFFVNLALCDFGVMVMDVFALLGAVNGKNFYLERPMLCEISGFICMMSCFGSLWTMMVIALNRFNRFYVANNTSGRLKSASPLRAMEILN